MRLCQEPPLNVSLHPPPSGFWTTHDSMEWGTSSPLDWGVESLPKGLGSSKRARMGYELGPSAKAGGKVGAGDKRRRPKLQQLTWGQGFSWSSGQCWLDTDSLECSEQRWPLPQLLSVPLKAPGNKNPFFIFIWKMPVPEILLSCKVQRKPARREDEELIALIQGRHRGSQTHPAPPSRSLLVHWDLPCVYKVCI